MPHATFAPITSPLTADLTVGALVADRPARSRIFEQLGIDYCCGGKIPLAEACAKKGLDPQTVVLMLRAIDASTTDSAPEINPATLTLHALADHIEQTHHAFLRNELPRLDTITEKVARVHGQHDPRLIALRNTFLAFSQEVYGHITKEEQSLFPLVRQLEQTSAASRPPAALADAIRELEHEHDAAGNALSRMSQLTDTSTPPDWACNTYRAMLDGLAHVEQDMHRHVHKENSILFPRALDLERSHAN